MIQAKKSATRWGLPLLAALLIGLSAQAADARGRHGGRHRVVIVPRASVGFYGYWGAPYFYSSFYRPYWGYHGRYGAPEGQLNPALAKALGVGGLDLNVKPRNAEVYVDGVFVGNARDFDGYPSYLWMDEGEHTVVISKGGYATYEQIFEVQGGVVSDLKLRLSQGPAEPPAVAPESQAADGSPTSTP